MPGRSIRFALALALLLSPVWSGVARAQGTARSPVQPSAPGDFMLGRPKGFLAVDGGFLFANAGSDVYDFVTEQLTLDKKAFNAPIVGLRLGALITPRLEVGVLVEQSRTSVTSEYRDFVDNSQLPITQTTGLQEYQVAANLRWSLVPSGRRISRFAWIPRTVTPFVGAGAGAIKYRFEQYGSFVDFQTFKVFNSTFRSEGWAPSAHAFVGADLRVYRRIYVTGEARYTWSSAPLGEDFVDFDPISLAGVRVGGSLKLVF
jgi:hypothetical protein